jgi:hypothetical protein
VNELTDMTGAVIGGLKVIRRDGHRANRPAWLCECVCGRESGVHRTVIHRRMKRGFKGTDLIKKGILK